MDVPFPAAFRLDFPARFERMPRMNPSLEIFRSTDGLALPGLLYEPSRGSREAAIFLHGNGDASVFYSARRTNAFGEELTRRGIAFFAVNNRGAHLIKRLGRKTGTRRASVLQGMTYEKIRDCVADIDGAVALLRGRGYQRIHLIGHSTGANKICLYNMKRPKNRLSKYVLLAPGDDVGIYFDALGPRRFARALDRARAEVARGRGNRFAAEGYSPFLISWASLLDTIDPDGDYNVFPFLETMRGLRLSRKPLFRHFRTVRKPTLALYGADDEYSFGEVERCVAILRERSAAPARFDATILPDTDHGFHGKEHEAGRAIAGFLAHR